MNLLVTGGAGFIGSTIVDRLMRQGHDIKVFDNFETGSRANLPAGIEVICGDVRDATALINASQGMDGIIHQAAMVSVPGSVAAPGTCFDINVQGTRNVLEAARQAGCRRVVLASTSAIYGENPDLPAKEDAPAAPASPYAYSKWLNEIDAAYYARYHGLETVALRYFNVFGPRQRNDSPYSGVIAIVLRALLAKQPITVYGTGLQTRDFVYVEDVATAVGQAIATPRLHNEVINVGQGQQVTLLELIETAAQLIGSDPELVFAPPRAGDVPHSRADISRLRDTLHHTPGVSLSVGLKHTLKWWIANQNVHAAAAPRKVRVTIDA
jgi:nucleoside-diphosphate-sugar epimerase